MRGKPTCTEYWSEGRAKLRAFPRHCGAENTQPSRLHSKTRYGLDSLDENRGPYNRATLYFVKGASIYDVRTRGGVVEKQANFTEDK